MGDDDNKASTTIYLDEENNIIKVKTKDGEIDGKGSLGSLLKPNEMVMTTKTINIIETKGSHYFYYCDASGNCTKINIPH